MTQKMVRKMLGNLGFSVSLAGNGQEAIESLEGQAVLLDCDMPIMDGLRQHDEFVQEKQPELGQTPIIALTGLTSETDRDTILAGATEHIAKPFGLADLQAALRPAFSRSINYSWLNAASALRCSSRKVSA